MLSRRSDSLKPICINKSISRAPYFRVSCKIPSSQKTEDRDPKTRLLYQHPSWIRPQSPARRPKLKSRRNTSTSGEEEKRRSPSRGRLPRSRSKTLTLGPKNLSLPPPLKWPRSAVGATPPSRRSPTKTIPTTYRPPLRSSGIPQRTLPRGGLSLAGATARSPA